MIHLISLQSWVIIAMYNIEFMYSWSFYCSGPWVAMIDRETSHSDDSEIIVWLVELVVTVVYLCLF